MNLTKGIYGYSAAFFGIYLLASLFAFWPRYLSDPASVAHFSVHVHGALMGLWLLALFTQALLIRTNRRDLHRTIGATSMVLAPALALSIVFVAHVSANRTDIDDMRLAQLALQLGYFPVFLGIYSLGMRYRRDPPRHSRFMLSTVLPMTSPVFDRVIGFYAMPELSFIPSFPDGSRLLPLIYLILVSLAAWDWRSHRRADVFPIVGLLFLTQHLFVLAAYRTTGGGPSLLGSSLCPSARFIPTHVDRMHPRLR